MGAGPIDGHLTPLSAVWLAGALTAPSPPYAAPSPPVGLVGESRIAAAGGAGNFVPIAPPSTPREEGKLGRVGAQLSLDRPSVAVLPFANLSGHPQQDYFSDGVSEDIITELSRFSELLINARNSAFQYRGKAVDIRKVGQELGAHYVLEGR